MALGILHQKKGNLHDAERCYKKAFELRKKESEEERDLIAAGVFELLKSILALQGKNEDAEAVLKKALAIREEVLGENHPDVSLSLKALAELLHVHRRLRKGEAAAHKGL